MLWSIFRTQINTVKDTIGRLQSVADLSFIAILDHSTHSVIQASVNKACQMQNRFTADNMKHYLQVI